jgi:hypothetical protein
LNFEHLDFDIVSDFGFRASDFAFLVAACPRQDGVKNNLPGTILSAFFLHRS